MASPIITCESLTRRFGDIAAVDGVDLAVAEGEIYGFLGPNGAGKSTIVRVLTTLLAPSDGTATVAGYDVATQPGEVRLRIGVALQEAALDDKQTGREILRLQARLFGLRKHEFEQRFADVADIIDLDAVDRMVGTYSGGMKRRLDLAAALIHNPDVLFLDEPTTGLDPVSRTRVWDEVRALNRDLGMTIFLTTQYLEEADELAGRVGIIDQGKIVAEGTPQELKRAIGTDVIVARIEGDPALALAALQGMHDVLSVEAHGDEVTVAAENGAAAISDVAVALNGSGVAVRELTLRTPTLDDVFLEVTGARMQDADSSQESDAEVPA